MRLSHPFSDSARNLFAEAPVCFACGFGGWDALHHIAGRTSSSPYNAAPVHNHGCHFERAGWLERNKGDLFAKAVRHLHSVGYRPLPDDLIFVRTHLKAMDPYLLPSERQTLFLEQNRPHPSAPRAPNT